MTISDMRTGRGPGIGGNPDVSSSEAPVTSPGPMAGRYWRQTGPTFRLVRSSSRSPRRCRGGTGADRRRLGSSSGLIVIRWSRHGGRLAGPTGTLASGPPDAPAPVSRSGQVRAWCRDGTGAGCAFRQAAQPRAEVAERVGEHPGDVHLGDAKLLAGWRSWRQMHRCQKTPRKDAKARW